MRKLTALLDVTVTKPSLCDLSMREIGHITISNLAPFVIKLQGDEEKRHGCQPLDMMDREKAHTLPQQQVKYEKYGGQISLGQTF